MYDGWLSVAGTEIVNHARSLVYGAALLPTLDMKDCFGCADLADILGDEPYVNPTADEAPWYDPDTPGSGEFIGFIASSLIGFEDSTRTAPVFESTLDGGTVGKTRKATREMRVSGSLIAASQVGTSAGLSWLKAALDGNLCNSCDDSDDVCFFTACPRTGENPDDLIRHLRRVKCIAGPTVISEDQLSCGGYMVRVEFTLTAGSPHVYGEPRMIAAAAGEDLTPILPGSEVFALTTPLPGCLTSLDDLRPNTVLRDPDCPPIPNPPTVPILTTQCKTQSFDTVTYSPVASATKVVASGGYNSHSVLATDGSIWVAAYSDGTSGGSYEASWVVKARTSTDFGATWSSEYTLYDEGSGTRGLQPVGMTYAADVDKFILAVNNYNFAVADRTFARTRGEILTSSTGLSGSWTTLGNIDSVMSGYGVVWYRITDVEHHEDGSTNGILYVSAFAQRTGQPTTVPLLLRSLDFGTTWQVMNQPFWYYPGEVFTWSQLCVWPDGEVGYFVLEDIRHEIWFRRTSDGGNTWAMWTVAATAAGGIPSPIVLADGSVRMHYRDMRDPGSRYLGQHNYKTSGDRGRTWNPGSPAYVTSTQGDNGADWALAPNGDIGIVYTLDYSGSDAKVYWTAFDNSANYLSYAIGVPDAAIRAWADGVMLLQIRTGNLETRQLRVRLIPRAFADMAPEDLDPCSACSSFIIDWAPANTVIYLDGMSQRVTMAVGAGSPTPADHLVSGENGSIFQWPTFSCGIGYFVVIDIDVATVADVALAIATRE